MGGTVINNSHHNYHMECLRRVWEEFPTPPTSGVLQVWSACQLSTAHVQTRCLGSTLQGSDSVGLSRA